MNPDLINIDVPYKQGRSLEEIFICCPFCLEKRGKSDEDFKLGVNLKKGKWHCFKCGTTQSESKLNLLANLEFYQPDKDIEAMIADISLVGVKKVEEPIDLEKFSYPMDDFETPFAHDYMTKDRNFSEEDISKLNLRVGKPFWDIDKEGRDFENKKWEGRIIFPFYENNECRYLIGRSYTGKDPKYLNWHTGKGRYIYGLDRVYKKKAILCEGIISAFSAEKMTNVTGISILGKFATDVQLTKIRTKVDTLWLCLDGGVQDKLIKKLEKRLLDFNFTLYKINLPMDADPDDLGEEFLPFFNNAEKVSIF